TALYRCRAEIQPVRHRARAHSPQSVPTQEFRKNVNILTLCIASGSLAKEYAEPSPRDAALRAMLDTNWQKLYEAAILEINPDKLVTRIGAADQAITQRKSVDITELERRKLADARSMLKTLSRIA